MWKQITEDVTAPVSGWGSSADVRQAPRLRRQPIEDGGLVARGRELANIDRNLQQARLGRASAIELRGESGVGKSALIEIAIARAPQFRTIMIRGDRASGLAVTRPEWPEPLKELVHQIELVDRANERPVAPPPVIDAVTGCLRRIAEQSHTPALLTIDDGESLPSWFVTAIAEAVCTRLQDKPITLIVSRNDAPNLPLAPVLSWPTTHTLTGLNAPQSAALLSSRLGATPNEQVIAQLVGGTNGNPLALLDICDRLTAEQLAGWQPLPDPLPVGPAVIDAFDLAAEMPDQTRASLTVRAVMRAPRERVDGLLASLGLEPDHLTPAVDAGVVAVNGTRMDFCHPLVRAAVFHGASPEHKRLARVALSNELERQNTFESRAYFAVADTSSPDEMVAGRFAESARAALDEGDPGAAAHNEEQAARFAASDDAVASHLAAAAALWRSAGVKDRARYCVEVASELTVGGAAAGQLAYQRAWLLQEQGESAVADQMRKAAELCVADAPHRAVSMLVDAAAWKLLSNDQSEAQKLAEQAVQLATTVGTHAENLAAAVRIAVMPGIGAATDDPATRSRISLLVGQTDHFPASPEVALIVGYSLQRQGLLAQSERWVRWIGRCAERDGDIQLQIAAKVLQGLAELTQLNIADATVAIDSALRDIDRADSATLMAWTWALSVQVRAISGEHERGFADSVQLFALPPAIGAIPRLLATASLASLDLQRGRLGATRAWIATAVEEIVRGGPQASTETRRLPALVIGLAPLASTMALLSGASFDSLEPLLSPIASETWPTWIAAVHDQDAEQCLDALDAIRERFIKIPAALAHIDLCYAAKLLQADRREDGRQLLERIRDAATATGAGGIATLASRQLHQLASNDAAGTVIGEAPAQGQLSAAGQPVPAASPVAAWDITLLGDFTVHCHGKPVHLPPSLATEAIKIVALQGQIIVDQLVELLWEDASPGVGVRRLRNVLWRIRTACGEVVVRDGQFVRLAHDAVTDLGRFEELAGQALARDATPQAAAAAAREALQLYRGELLPANRYDDWTTRARELVSRSKVSLLEMLIDDALDNEQTGEALALLDRLAAEDPNDESPLVRMAELHLLSGNRSRALESLDRAESILRDLGIGTTPAITRLRETLSRR